MPFHQESDGEERAYDPRTIAARATRYYGDLFENPGEDDTEVQTLISTLSQDWHNSDVVMMADDIQTAIYAMARGKTTGSDGLPAEAWHMAADHDSRICMALAWAFNQRILDVAPGPRPQRPHDEPAIHTIDADTQKSRAGRRGDHPVDGDAAQERTPTEDNTLGTHDGQPDDDDDRRDARTRNEPDGPRREPDNYTRRETPRPTRRTSAG